MGEDFGPSHLALLAIATTSLGLALHANDGSYSAVALAALTVAMIATFAVFFVKERPKLPATPVLAACVAVELAVVAFRPIASVFPVKGAMLWPFYAGVGVSAALVGAITFGRERWLRFLVPLLLVTFTATAIWVLKQAQPVIDVFIFQQQSSEALLQGRNPWALTFPNPYRHTRFYGPGLVVNGRLQFGYPYTPLPLLMVLPAFVLVHDIRYAHVIAVALAAGLVAYARQGRNAALAAALFLFTPRVFLLLVLGWIEPLVVLLFALLVFTMLRRPKLVPYAFGLFLAVKQYLVFIPFLAGLVARGKALVRLLVIAGLVAAVAIVPLALWNVRAFWHSAVSLQLVQPFRRDALSYAAWIARLTGEELSSLAFIAVVPAIFVSARKAPKTAAGFATAVSATYLTFFAFNKQAFANYYYFVVGALCVAIAAISPGATKSAAAEGS